MTRQKKEILKKIDALENEIEIDRGLSFGVSTRFEDKRENELMRLWDELAHLRGFADSDQMFYDPRIPGSLDDWPD